MIEDQRDDSASIFMIEEPDIFIIDIPSGGLQVYLPTSRPPDGKWLKITSVGQLMIVVAV